MGRTRNVKLAAAIAALGLSQSRLAARVRVVAQEHGVEELAGVGQSHIAKWVSGVVPAAPAARILAETLSRGLSRLVTLADIGLATDTDPQPQPPAWSDDTLTTLVTLGSTDMDIDRRQLLATSVYSVAALALPEEQWFEKAVERAHARRPLSNYLVTSQDVEDVREMAAIFSRRDQKRGGRAGRTALVAYLRTDVAELLSGRFPTEEIRRSMTSAAAELAYLAGWTAFDGGEHSLAQRWLTIATKLAEEAADAPLAGHVLRAMAHQAVDLGKPQEAVRFAEASLSSRRYAQACWRERSLLGVVHARGLAAAGEKKAAVAALLQAERDLGRASAGDDEPTRVFFFAEASLAHETAAALRDLGDLQGAEKQFSHSVRTRRAQFARTHSVTLGYLGAVQAQQGHLDLACDTWGQALDAMTGVQSGRAKETVVQMRRALSPFRNRAGSQAAELDARARAMLLAG
ncbi:Tat pathway signal protein [Streptomyces agglomeratus]|uniref:Tat pathway signal protein n=1 Tax=Streptomyces agglomeratus TaxID=285458 RepID=UPI0008526990|nr:Tat pathway signal protein [Streptomyces agglomeratus]OEJ56718.1 Tat pathway signal protein [Streptomyces agglomeratus]